MLMAAYFRTRNIRTLHSPQCSFVFASWVFGGFVTNLFRLVLDSSLACVVLYTCVNVNGRLFQNEKYSHTSFVCLFVLLLVCLAVSSQTFFALFQTHHQRVQFFTLVRMFMAAFFRARNIQTLHSSVYLCLPLGCLGVALCLWAPVLEQGIFTDLFCLPVYLCQTVFAAWVFRYVCGRLFQNKEYSHTFFACLFVLYPIDTS